MICWTGWPRYGLLFASLRTNFLVFWGPVFLPWVTSWWLRNRQENQRGQLGLQGWISNDFYWIWGTCWESIFISLLVFSCFEVINFECQLWGMFFSGFGWEMVPGSVVGCVANMINTVVFVRFHFFTYLVNWMISNWLLDAFWIAFLDTLPGLTCSDLWGSGE